MTWANGTIRGPATSPARTVRCVRARLATVASLFTSGHDFCVQRFGGPALRVLTEDSNEELLVTPVSEEDIYNKGGECAASGSAGSLPDRAMRADDRNIITWNEPGENSAGVDLALSFQDRGGCGDIWYASATPRHLRGF